MIGCLIDCFFSLTHIGSHHFLWMGDRKSISMIYSLQTHAMFQALKTFSKRKHLPPTGWVAIITWSSHFQKFNQRLYHDLNSVTCVQTNSYTLFVAVTRFVMQMIFSKFYRQGMNSMKIFTIIISTDLSNQYIHFNMI